jgi:hypothetical protein
MPSFTESPKAWEPGSFSSHQRFHAFAHIGDLPQAERSIRAAYNQHRTRCLGKSGELQQLAGTPPSKDPT